MTLAQVLQVEARTTAALECSRDTWRDLEADMDGSTAAKLAELL